MSTYISCCLSFNIWCFVFVQFSQIRKRLYFLHKKWFLHKRCQWVKILLGLMLLSRINSLKNGFKSVCSISIFRITYFPLMRCVYLRWCKVLLWCLLKTTCQNWQLSMIYSRKGVCMFSMCLHGFYCSNSSRYISMPWMWTLLNQAIFRPVWLYLYVPC